MDALVNDLRYAARSLFRSPSFTLIAVLCLALGIGANTAIFSMVNGLLLRPLPLPDSDHLVMMWDENRREGREFSEVAPGNLLAIRERSRAFEGIAAFDFSDMTITGSGEAERLRGFVAEPALFTVLGVQAALGRTFLAEESDSGRNQVVVLSHGFWRRRFASDPGIVGRQIMLNQTSHTVVGVLPADFQFPSSTDVWTPLTLSDSVWQNREGHWLRVVGRLQPGVSLTRARADVDAIMGRLEVETPRTNSGWRMSVVSIQEGLFQGPIKPMMMVLLGAVGFVLLIACADVSNLLLARASARHREIAVRTALGASRGRVIRQLLTESTLLALLGAGLGVLLAVWGLDLLHASMPSDVAANMPHAANVRVDGTVLVFTLGVSLAAALVFGLAPALGASRPDLNEALKESGRGATSSARRHRLRSWLVSAEVALALVLMTGAGLMVKSFLRQQTANPGFGSANMLTFQLSLPNATYPDSQRILGYYRALETRLAALPGVRAAGAANVLALTGEGSSGEFTVTDRPLSDPNEAPRGHVRIVRGDYLGAMGIPLLSGRAFGAQDTESSQRVVIISRALAERFFAGEDPIGKSLTPRGARPRQIIGVAADITDWRQSGRMNYYLYVPHVQAPRSGMVVTLRTDGDPLALAGAVRREVTALDPDVPLSGLRSMAQIRAEATQGLRMSSRMFSGLAAMALLLAIAGIYGVMAFAVLQRTHEIGVRMALGADRASVLGLVMRQGMLPVAIGIVLGIVGSLALSRGLSALLFDVSATDPLTFVSVAAVLAAAATVAMYVPARRAARVDPVVALRYE